MTSVYLNSSLYIDQDLPWEFSQHLSGAAMEQLGAQV